MRKLLSSASLDGRRISALSRAWLLPLTLAAACSSGASAASDARAGAPTGTADLTGSTAGASASPAAPSSAAGVSHETSPSPAAGAKAADTKSPIEFLPEAKALYRLVICGSDEPVPARLDARLVEAHCARMKAAVDTFQSGWLASARPFLASLRPAQLPDRVVYPFGGGDLMWAIITYPDAVEYTTISLEPAGDPRGVDTVDSAKLAASYRINAKNVILQLKVSHSRTDNLTVGAKDTLPSELILDLAALRVHGLEPVSMRYFRITDAGELEYLTKERLDATPAGEQPDLFDDVELAFRPIGQPDAPVKVLRHVAFDLSDGNLGKHPGLLRHLEAKGKVSAMTKAASYLLWSSAFGKIRDYLLAHMAWMISDSTGVPPRIAGAAGFAQETYGRFDTPFLPAANKRASEEVVAMWRAQPRRDMPIIYGYPDGNHHWHMMVTRPMTEAERAAAQAKAAAQPDSAPAAVTAQSGAGAAPGAAAPSTVAATTTTVATKPSPASSTSAAVAPAKPAAAVQSKPAAPGTTTAGGAAAPTAPAPATGAPAEGASPR